MKYIIHKVVLDRKLYWTGTEWHPDKSRAIKYDTVGQAWEVLANLVLAEGYAVEEA